LARPRKLPLELEAKKFAEENREALPPPKPLTTRRLYLGLAMCAILSRSPGAREEDVKAEAERWAKIMSEID